MSFTKTLGGLLLIAAGAGIAIHQAVVNRSDHKPSDIVIYLEDDARTALNKSDRIVDHGRAAEIRKWLTHLEEYESSGEAFEAVAKAQADRIESDKAQIKAWLFQYFGADESGEVDRFDRNKVREVFGAFAEELESR